MGTAFLNAVPIVTNGYETLFCVNFVTKLLLLADMYNYFKQTCRFNHSIAQEFTATCE